MRATIRTPWAASLLLGALTAGLIVTPALAAPGYQPDGRIQQGPFGVAGDQALYNPGPWLGYHIYNATGAHQTAVVTQTGGADAVGIYYTFGISIQNDGSATDRFKVKATGAPSAWVVTYSRGTTNITSAVVAGTYQTPSLAPGATYLISARITLPQSSNLSFSVARLVTIRSVANSTKIDAVKFGFLWNPGVPMGG